MYTIHFDQGIYYVKAPDGNLIPGLKSKNRRLIQNSVRQYNRLKLLDDVNAQQH